MQQFKAPRLTNEIQVVVSRKTEFLTAVQVYTSLCQPGLKDQQPDPSNVGYL